MKKWIMLVLLALLLQGCAAQEVFETVEDAYQPGVLPAAAQISLHLPDEQALMALENENREVLYLYEDYTVSIQTMQSGNIAQTLREVTGYAVEELTLLQTMADGCRRYQCVWTSAGETGNQIGRLCVLDDGVYHYVVAVMGHEAVAGEMTGVWQDMLDSFDIY